jgi:hypothetical protein
LRFHCSFSRKNVGGMHSLHLSEVIKKFPFRWRLIYLGAVHRKKNNRIVYLLIYQCKVGTAVRTWTRSRMSHFQRQNTDHLRERFFEIISSARSSPTKNGGPLSFTPLNQNASHCVRLLKHHSFRFWPSTSGYLHFSTAPEPLPCWWTRAPPEPQKFIDDQH